MTPPTHDPIHLSPAEVAGLVNLIQAQIEYHEREVKRLEAVAAKIRRQIKKTNELREQDRQ